MSAYTCEGIGVYNWFIAVHTVKQLLKQHTIVFTANIQRIVKWCNLCIRWFFKLYFVDNGHVEKEEFVHYFTEVRLIDIFRIVFMTKVFNNKRSVLSLIYCRWFVVDLHHSVRHPAESDDSCTWRPLERKITLHPRIMHFLGL